MLVLSLAQSFMISPLGPIRIFSFLILFLLSSDVEFTDSGHQYFVRMCKSTPECNDADPTGAAVCQLSSTGQYKNAGTASTMTVGVPFFTSIREFILIVF
jgi:hypothetical protein